jgi:3-hydroxyisobutyrate dehydrogenase-like beta-hydroxyacid dehydrogenase
MIASANEAMGEAASLVEGYDVSGRSFLEMITSTLFLGPVHAGYGRAIANQQYEPAGFKMTLALKDLRLVLEAAERAATPMPFASVLKDNLLDAIAHGAADHDWAALAEVSARRAGRRSRHSVVSEATAEGKNTALTR